MTDTTPAQDAETIAWTTHLAGCDEAVHRGQRLGWCITHGMKKRTPWPCPAAVDLAAKIAARDARRDATLAALLREDSPDGEDLRVRLGLRLETSFHNCRRCIHDPMGLDHEGACVLNLNQWRLMGEWEDMP